MTNPSSKLAAPQWRPLVRDVARMEAQRAWSNTINPYPAMTFAEARKGKK